MLGVILAFGALFCWAFGDYFIQKTTKAVGIWKALLYITLTGTIGLLPFVNNEIPTLITNTSNLLLLLATGIILFLAAVFEFRGFKEGKLSVIEPALGVELPITILLSIFIWNERPTLGQGILMIGVFIGITLAVTLTHRHLHYHKKIFERGVIFALLGAVLMGVSNFLMGVSSQQTSPLLTMWFTSAILSVLSFIYMSATGELHGLFTSFKKYQGIILGETILDNLAWICYVFAMSLIPISLATTISESYIAVAVLLGFFINKDKLKHHQKLGVVLATMSVILLSGIS